jgi:hypothetical protein
MTSVYFEPLGLENLFIVGLTHSIWKKSKKLGVRRANARRTPNFLAIPGDLRKSYIV